MIAHLGAGRNSRRAARPAWPTSRSGCRYAMRQRRKLRRIREIQREETRATASWDEQRGAWSPPPWAASTSSTTRRRADFDWPKTRWRLRTAACADVDGEAARPSSFDSAGRGDGRGLDRNSIARVPSRYARLLARAVPPEQRFAATSASAGCAANTFTTTAPCDRAARQARWVTAHQAAHGTCAEARASQHRAPPHVTRLERFPPALQRSP